MLTNMIPGAPLRAALGPGAVDGPVVVVSGLELDRGDHLTGGGVDGVDGSGGARGTEPWILGDAEGFQDLLRSRSGVHATQGTPNRPRGRYPLHLEVPMALDRDGITRRAAQELQDGFYVNLGIGMPTLVANHVPEGMEVWLQSENGLLGMGAFPTEEAVDADLINAGKQTVTGVTGHSFFSSADSFAMIRGGHIDLAILGAMEISQRGDIANWMIPGKLVKGMGGAMDLVAGVKRVIVTMDHCNKKGAPKIIPECTLPLTGTQCIDMVITDLCVMEMDRDHNRFRVTELAPDVTREEVEAKTTAELLFADELVAMAH